MSQMNKGGIPKAGSGKPWAQGVSPKGAAINAAKGQIAHQEGKIDRGLAQYKKGGADNQLMGAMNVSSGQSGVAKGQAALAAAHNMKPGGGPVTMGARTGKGSAPTQLGKAKIQSVSLGATELAAKKMPVQTVGGAQQLGAKRLPPQGPAFKTGGVSNPMGRQGAKPGVLMGRKPPK
jgi:hypothetical protein